MWRFLAKRRDLKTSLASQLAIYRHIKKYMAILLAIFDEP